MTPPTIAVRCEHGVELWVSADVLDVGPDRKVTLRLPAKACERHTPGAAPTLSKRDLRKLRRELRKL